MVNQNKKPMDFQKKGLTTGPKSLLQDSLTNQAKQIEWNKEIATQLAQMKIDSQL